MVSSAALLPARFANSLSRWTSRRERQSAERRSPRASGCDLATFRRAQKQRLADRRAHRLFLEGLGDQIGRLWPLARKQAFGEGRDEDHRHRELLQNETGRASCRERVGQYG